MNNKHTLKKEGYKYIASMGEGQHILSDKPNHYEVWFSNLNHASYGLIYKNTHLEFARSIELKQVLQHI